MKLNAFSPVRNALVTFSAIFLLGSMSNLAAAPLVGLTTGNRLVSFDSATPGTIFADVAVSGLGTGQGLVGIDFRPADGMLIGLARDSSGQAQVYSLNVLTGAATALSAVFALPGSAFGVDFNPVPNAFRIVSDFEANMRITAGGAGTVNTDTSLTRTSGVADPTLQVTGAAYSNNNPGGAGGQTTLYVIDSASGNLYTQGTVNFPGSSTSPNTGLLFLVGSLGLGSGLTDRVGFDIRNTGEAFLSLGNSLYSINVSSGQTSLLGSIGTAGSVTDITASPLPEPSTLVLTSLALLGATAFRKKLLKR